MVKEIIKDKDLILDVPQYDIILLASGIKNSYGNGFLHKVCRCFPDVGVAIKKEKYDDPHKLGTCTVVSKDDKTFVVCYITKGRYRPDRCPDALDYAALRSCLELINANFKGKTIASTILGCDVLEAGGNKDKIIQIFEEFAPDVNFYLYDYPQEDYRSEDNRNYNQIYEDYTAGKFGTNEYYNKKKRFIWQKKFGIFSEPPADKSYREIKKLLK